MKRASLIVLLGLVPLLMAACGDDPSTTSTPASTAPSTSSSAEEEEATAACADTASAPPATGGLRAELKDFEILLDSMTMNAGEVTVTAANTGTVPHEIVFVKGVAPGDLPKRDSGVGLVDEDRFPPGAGAGELEAFAPGQTCTQTFEFDKGTYTLFCNLFGEEGVHVKLGMVATLTVE